MTVFVLINDETVFHVWEFGATMLMTCKIRNVVGDVWWRKRGELWTWLLAWRNILLLQYVESLMV